MLEAIDKCRACKSKSLIEFLDLGEQYLSDFREDTSKPPKYPLVAVLCDSCKLVQLKHTTPQEEMYHDRYGFKSNISDSIKEDLEDIIVHAQIWMHNANYWLDIGCNDGYLLSQVDQDVYRVGVDPVKFLCKEAEPHADLIVNDYFGQKAIDKIVTNGFRRQGQFDIITTISCFYDMPDPVQFVKDVKSILSDDGIWVIQQNYLYTTMQLGAVDNFVHEHLEYYTLLSLENLLNRFDLEVNEVKLSEVNGGSIRTVVSHKGTHPIHNSVEKQRVIEREAKLDTVEPYKKFAKNIWKSLDDLRENVMRYSAQGKCVAILAASTRGSTIWQAAGINSENVQYAIERNPAKVGKYFSAIGVPIISEAQAAKDNPDFKIIGPWFFVDEIISREKKYVDEGGILILPLPEYKEIGRWKW